jgi:hypothetical protein
MKITIEVSNRVVEAALANMLDNTVFDSFEARTLKAAKIPTAKKIIKDVMADEKFLEQLAKDVAAGLDEEAEDLVYDYVDNHAIVTSVVDGLIERCEQIELAEEEKEAAEQKAEFAANQSKRDADDVARMVRALNKLGYKITKDGK